MSERYACTADGDPEERERGLDAAVSAIHRGDLVVLPTDTVYGIAADAFEPDAVDKLLEAKGRGRSMPPPVLVASTGALDGVAAEVPDSGRRLVEQRWPGGLTIICREQPSLLWDLGDTRGTVAVRMPDQELALELLGRTGPLAVSSANASGSPAAENADEAEIQLQDAVAVYLDGGATAGATPSTIVDLTSSPPRVLRAGVIGIDRLREAVPEMLDVDELPESTEEPATTEEASGSGLDGSDSAAEGRDAEFAAGGQDAASAAGGQATESANHDRPTDSADAADLAGTALAEGDTADSVMADNYGADSTTAEADDGPVDLPADDDGYGGVTDSRGLPM